MRTYKKGLSYLRILACFGIVLLHTVNVAELLYAGQISAFADTVSQAVLNCLRWAVPCFVMITGALLLDPEKEIPLKKNYGTYLVRVLLALLVFSFVYRIFSLVMNGESFSASVFPEVLKNVATGGGWAHLWYLYVLVGLYLLLPLLRSFAKAAGRTEMLALLLVCFLFLSVLPVTRLAGAESAFSIPVTSIYPFYLLAGYAIDKGLLRIPNRAALLAIAVTVPLIVLAVFRNADGRFDVLLSYSSVLVVPLSCAVFSLFAGKPASPAAVTPDGQPKKSFRILQEVDRCCFGIYLVHLIFLRLFLRYWKWNPYADHAVLRMAGVALLSFAASLLVSFLLKKIPGFRKLL